MAFIWHSLLTVDFIADYIAPVLSAELSNFNELFFFNCCTRRIAWIGQEQVVVLSLQFDQSLFEHLAIKFEFAILVWWNLVMIISSQFGLRSVWHPGRSWCDKIALENLLENKKIRNRSWTDQNVLSVDWVLGVLLIELSNSLSERQEPLYMDIILLVSLLTELFKHAFWWWEWGLTKSKFVNLFTLSD